jgi:GMP synthase-like glutamine amidotransferase
MSQVRARRFAVLQCEDWPHWRPHERLWADHLAGPGEEWQVYRAWAGELPPAPDACAGYVVTGSHHSVNDPTQTWLEPLFDFLRACAAHPDGGQLFGVCFGLQAIARALGGRVEKNPGGGFCFGTERVALAAEVRDTWYGAGLPDAVTALTSHSEQAVELPPGARRLAGSGRTAHEMFAVEDRVLAIQFHPEFTPAMMEELILPTALADRRLDAAGEARARAEMAAPLDSRRLLDLVRRFLDRPGR